jgi:hypothetical protein
MADEQLQQFDKMGKSKCSKPEPKLMTRETVTFKKVDHQNEDYMPQG